MIKDFEKYHGSFFARVAHNYKNIKISLFENNDNSSYIINDNCGVYIKFSKKRLTPWQFTFTHEHYNYIKELSKETIKGYVVLLCHDDGFCCVDFNEFYTIITDIEVGLSKTVSVSRFKNQQYSVSGTDGKINHKFVDAYIELI